MKYADSLLNENTSRQIAELDKKFESAQKDKELIMKDAEIVKQAAETEKQTTQRNYFILGFIIMLILVVFVFRGYKQKQKANEIIAFQKKEVEIQKSLIEEKQKEIVDSINYARKIQTAILPSLEHIREHLPQAFIFYKPKDIVSGDFYWFTEKNGYCFLVVADCTGHGVPGAFMSMIGNDMLTQIIIEKGILQPNHILTHLHESVKKWTSRS
jgi:hypothetical protein